MPLNADDPSAVGKLERLDQAVDDRRRDETLAERFLRHGLVMARVDRERHPTDGHPKTRPRSCRYVAVLHEAFAFLRTVPGDVLDEAAALHDVQDREPAADPEDRQIAGDGRLSHLTLDSVAITVDLRAADHRP